MLIQPEREKLGDKVLRGAEALAQSFEQTDKALEQYRLPDQQQLKNVDARTGQPMHFTELVARIRKLNPSLWVEDSIHCPGHVGIYRHRTPTAEDPCDKEFLVAFPAEVLPEYSIIEVDAADLPIRERRGWRTVLVRLLQQKALRIKGVIELFGDASGESSARWRFYLHSLQN
jgi:hypothetical protein